MILYLHGGAFIVGSAQTHRHVAAQLAGAAGTRALVPSYRLAPENPFPAGLEDALTCYRSLLGSHEPGQIAFAGDSAGGGLVFSLLLAAAEAGLPQPAAAVAFSPAADLTLSGASHRENAARDAMLPQHRSAEMVAMYLQGQDADQPKPRPHWPALTPRHPVSSSLRRPRFCATTPSCWQMRWGGAAAMCSWSFGRACPMPGRF